MLGAQPTPAVEADSAPALPPRFERWTDAEVELPLLSMTVSGGVSLGSYEAGYLYYLDADGEAEPDAARPARVLEHRPAASTRCSRSWPAAARPTSRPTTTSSSTRGSPSARRGCFRKTASRPSASSPATNWRKSVERIKALRGKWANSTRACDVVLGVTTTRVTAQAVDSRRRGRVERFAANRGQVLGAGARPGARRGAEHEQLRQPARPRRSTLAAHERRGADRVRRAGAGAAGLDRVPPGVRSSACRELHRLGEARAERQPQHAARVHRAVVA